MAEVYKSLGQIDAAVATLETLYTVPASTATVVSSITVCNRGATDVTFRIAVRPAGAAIDNKHYIYYDHPLTANRTFIATVGITMATTDVLSVYGSSGNETFNAYGCEVT